ncbi:MAG TPA: hypothetical protein VF679_13300 [Pedobacter sp.]
MIDQILFIDGKGYEITDKQDMHMVTVTGCFVGYITKDGEYIGKSLTESTILQLKEAIL